MTKKPTSFSSPLPLPIVGVAFLVVLLVGIKIVLKSTTKPQVQPITSEQHSSFDFGNQTITLDDKPLLFKNGELQTSGSNNNDGAALLYKNINPTQTRAATILVTFPQGSGTFYYLVGAMKQDVSEKYSTPVLLGDRIKIESVSVDDPQAEDNGMITIQYLDRSAQAPMSSEPNIKKTKKFAFQNDGNLIEVLH